MFRLCVDTSSQIVWEVFTVQCSGCHAEATCAGSDYTPAQQVSSAFGQHADLEHAVYSSSCVLKKQQPYVALTSSLGPWNTVWPCDSSSMSSNRLYVSGGGCSRATSKVPSIM